MNALEFSSVADIVTSNIKTANIFKKNGIDYTCEGNLSIAEACKKNNLNYYNLVLELAEVEKNTSYLKDYNAWQLDFLVDYLVSIHHEYIEDNIPFLKNILAEISKIHGEKHPKFYEIYDLIYKVGKDLTNHVKAEEKVLFPYIKKLLKAKRERVKYSFKDATYLEYSLTKMQENQNYAITIFKKIAKLTNNYTSPQINSKKIDVLYYKLQKFEEDLIKHLHLENNILFPKAKKLENIVKLIS